ncbi:hypothetical protein BT69DRAFT_1281979 [Atractiella rhizophila]|nr:hypothetical protein BT69DRAFT_1281979 [Atractiella rhizophila]
MSRFAYLLPPSLAKPPGSPRPGSAAGFGAGVAGALAGPGSEECRVCGEPTKTKCLGCKIVGYCSEEHLKADWANHILTCNASTRSSTLTQLGLLFLGSISANPTPVPKSLSHLSTLNRPHLSSLLIPPCPPERLKVLIAPISLIFDGESALVLAYDAGPKGQRIEGGIDGIKFNSAPGEICRMGVSYTRDPKTGRGMQMRGSCLMFWLKSGRDFTTEDFDCIDDVVGRVWPPGSPAATEEILVKIQTEYREKLEEMRKRKEEEEKNKPK